LTARKEKDKSHNKDVAARGQQFSEPEQPESRQEKRQDHWKAAMKEVRKNEELLEITFRSIGDAVIATDEEGRITRMNPAAERTTGWSLAGARGKPLAEVFNIVNALTGEPADDPAARVLATGNATGLANHTMLISRDGVRCHIMDSAALIQDDEGAARGVVVVFSDVTETYAAREELRKSEERWQFALEGSGDGVWDRNLVTGEVFFSRQWKALLGYGEDEIGNTLDEWEWRIHPDDRESCRLALEKHFSGATPLYTHEYRMRCKDGSYRWILARGRVVERDEEGRPHRFIGVHTDITEHKQEEAQKEQDLLEAREQARDQKRCMDRLSELASGLWLHESEMTSGVITLTETAADIMKTARTSLWFFNDDFSELTCRDLYDSERHWHSGGEILPASHFPDYVASHARGKVIAAEDVHADPRTAQIPAGYFTEAGITSLLDAPIWVKGKLAGVLSFEHRGAKRSWLPEEEQMAVILSAYASNFLEEIERKRAVEALRASEENFRRSLDESPLGIRVVSASGATLYANRAVLDMFGYDDIEELRSTPAAQRYTGRSYAEHRARKERRGRGNDGESEYDVDIVRKDGEIRHLRTWRKKILWNGEEHYQVIYRDVTEQKRAEKDLRRYREFIENIEDACFELDLSGKLTFHNEPFLRLSGHTLEEERNKSPRDRHPTPEEARRVFKIYNTVYRTGIPAKSVEYQFNRKNGDVGIIEVSISLIRDASGIPVGFRGIGRDISERKRLEAEREQRLELERRLLRAQKLESIGTLAGGIAHDFNNLLMGIQGYTSLMLLDLEPSHPHHERLRRIEEQVAGGAALTGQLLGFARGGRYEVRPASLTEIIEQTAGMFGRTKKEVTLHRRFAPDLWTVEVDRTQMEQVFMNLFVNAWQAMSGGGDLYLDTENIVLDESRARAGDLAPGRYVKASVTDTGMGMDERTRERIFDPFFSTKGMGRGTGLGLATVYGIIRSHRGMINVYSEPGRGTTFSLYLPASEKAVADESDDPSVAVIHRGDGTILLVDDEAMVLEVSRELLESLGYRVHTAAGGREAVALYEEKGREIDLVILDMIMPGLSGSETFDRLRAIDSRVRIILSSGYSLNGEAKTIMDRGCAGFLQKPFQLAQLSQKVRDVLDTSNPDECA
jgi:PAS domain S-box-containing protein